MCLLYQVLSTCIRCPEDCSVWQAPDTRGSSLASSLLSRQAVAIAREELVYRLEDLTRFEYVTPEGRDQGINVRHRCGNPLRVEEGLRGPVLYLTE